MVVYTLLERNKELSFQKPVDMDKVISSDCYFIIYVAGESKYLIQNLIYYLVLVLY